MSTLTDEMKRMLGAQLAILATVTDGTTPNIGRNVPCVSAMIGL